MMGGVFECKIIHNWRCQSYTISSTEFRKLQALSIIPTGTTFALTVLRFLYSPLRTSLNVAPGPGKLPSCSYRVLEVTERRLFAAELQQH